MLDAQGQVIHVGARVTCGGMEGVVVCSIDTGEGSPEYPIEQWAYLKHGVMVQTREAGLIHYSDGSSIVQISD